MAKREPSEISESEGASSEEDWIQDDEDADSIGDEDLDIYGDDFDSEDSDEEEAVIEKIRQDAAGAGQDNKPPASIDAFGKIGTERHTIMAWDAHQSSAAPPAQRRARPSDTQRARLSDTRKRIPPQSAGRSRPISRHVRPSQQHQSHMSWDADSQPVRQVFRGVSRTENDEPRQALEEMPEQDSANHEKEPTLQKDAADTEGNLHHEEHGGDDQTQPAKSDEEEMAGEQTDSETRVGTNIRADKETSDELGSKQVHAVLSGGSEESEATSESDGASDAKKVLPLPLKLADMPEEAEEESFVEEAPPVAPFIATMHQIVCDPQNWHCVRWGGEGKTLLFADPTTFNLRLIPRYFRGTWRSRCGALNGTAYDFSEVVRTLRAFGFTKVNPSDPDRMEFEHRWFQQHSTDTLHRLAPRRVERCTSAPSAHLSTSAHLMLLPRPWTPVGPPPPRPRPRPTTAPGSALQPKPPPTPRTPCNTGGRAQAAWAGEGRRPRGGASRQASVDSARAAFSRSQSGSVAGQEVSLHRSRSGEALGAPPPPPTAQHAPVKPGAAVGVGPGPGQGGATGPSKFHFLRREQKRREAELAARKAEGEKKSGAGKLLSVVELASSAHKTRRQRQPAPHPAADLSDASSTDASEEGHPQARSPTAHTRPGGSPRSAHSGSPGMLARSRSMLHARRKDSGQVLVGFWDGGVPGEAGMRVKRSFEGIDHRLRKGTPMGWWTEAVGVITEVETDGRMCLVQWQSGKEEWCCSGFSDLFYLQQFIVKEADTKHASTWKKEARLGPHWFVTGQGVWRMDRLKSKLKVNMQAVEREAAADKLLPSVRKMVGRHFTSEAARQKEEQRARAKLQRRQQRNAGEAPRQTYKPKPATLSLAEGAEAPAMAEIDHVEGVGDFFRAQGPMERIVSQGLVSQLGKILRRAYGDCEKLPNGNLTQQAVVGAVSKMGLDITRAALLQALQMQDPGESGEVSLDAFLDCMYHLLQRIAPPKPRTPLRVNRASLAQTNDK